MSARIKNAILFCIDAILAALLIDVLRESLLYGSQFGQDIFEIVPYLILILVSMYSMFMHYKFRDAKDSGIQRLHYWTYIVSVILFLAPMIYYYTASLFIENANETIGFGVGLFYVGWSIFLSIAWLINTIIIGSIALAKYEKEEI